MDNYGADNNGEFNRLISELTQGRDLVQQLQLHLNVPNYNSSSSSSENTREFLLHNIQSKFDRALSMLQYNSSTGDYSNSPLAHSTSPAIPIFGMSDSPRSSPPHSEDSDRDLEPKDPATRKRKSNTPRWTQKVQINPGAPVEGTLDDGFSWRKYGQKDILGAKHPRGYYRCTLRHVQDCLATKQVQRSDEDPTIFEVTYRGRHTCNQGGGAGASNVNPAPAQAPLAVIIPQNQEPNLGNHEHYQQLIPVQHPNFNFNNHPNNVPYVPSFNNFPSSSSHVNSDHQDYSFLPNSSTIPSNSLVENFSPAFNMSAGTSEMNNFEGKQNGADYQFNSMGFESNFPYDY
ncbi:hypothetical protein HAX54_022552 [Datura stramonium]|uniref:WRKY domain-containing protein n=1 Tax=Datura stramonium TaxID=4076 RepID=A0ABS8S4D6_DATST|nr:hypothetical protein [Datura stramonium]